MESDSVALRKGLALLVVAAVFLSCEGKISERVFRKRIERVYIETHPGWSIVGRDFSKKQTLFGFGDQVDGLPYGALFQEYSSSGQSSGQFLEGFKSGLKREAASRRVSLADAKDRVIPILKGGAWIQARELGSIAPAAIRDQVRPWKKKIADDLYAVLGVPEEKMGYRFASIQELRDSSETTDTWMARALVNLKRQVRVEGGDELRGRKGTLIVYDLANDDGVSALILDPGFRKEMLARFRQDSLGAAAPARNVLILFKLGDPIVLKPARSRAHQLFDSLNYPGFRGLLRFDGAGVSILERAGGPSKP